MKRHECIETSLSVLNIFCDDIKDSCKCPCLFSQIGIGRGIAIKLAECGAQVVGISRTQADLGNLKEQVCNICQLCMLSFL